MQRIHRLWRWFLIDLMQVGVAEQFGNLRNYLGQVFSFVQFLQFLKGVGHRITGKRVPVGEISVDEFSKGAGKTKSSRPLWVFLSMLIGLPWLVSMLLKRIGEKKAINPASFL